MLHLPQPGWLTDPFWSKPALIILATWAVGGTMVILLAGLQDTRVEVASAVARIHPNIVGYVGGYYQWPNNWKFTGRLGVQSFGGLQLPNATLVQPFTQPIVRLDLDRVDDNDNRLFGVTAQIMWVPRPSYQLTLRTPLYFVRN